uniref:RCC1 and BTB domain-containing protein 1 n=1 Tax=Lygus hesperus TaxID=30085 RepID=A0A0K8T2M2_LYGHE
MVYGLGENGSDTNILGFNCRHFECERIEQLELVKGLSGKNIGHITVGCNVGAAIDGEGRIYWWGNCDEVDDEIATPHLASMSTSTNKIKFTQVSCVSRFMAALAHTGNVYVWGKLKAGRSSMFMRKVMLDTSPHKIIKLTTGKNHLVMLTTKGAVYTWGCNDHGQRGILQDDNDEYSITKLQLNQPCKDIVCGLSSTVVLTSNGEVWACGENYWGTQVGYSAQIERVDLGCKIDKIIVGWCCVAGTYQSLYVATDGNGEHFVWSDTTAPA